MKASRSDASLLQGLPELSKGAASIVRPAGHGMAPAPACSASGGAAAVLATPMPSRGGSGRRAPTSHG